MNIFKLILGIAKALHDFLYIGKIQGTARVLLCVSDVCPALLIIHVCMLLFLKCVICINITSVYLFFKTSHTN